MKWGLHESGADGTLRPRLSCRALLFDDRNGRGDGRPDLCGYRTTVGVDQEA
jgi:hypothetical protein